MLFILPHTITQYTSRQNNIDVFFKNLFLLLLRERKIDYRYHENIKSNQENKQTIDTKIYENIEKINNLIKPKLF